MMTAPANQPMTDTTSDGELLSGFLADRDESAFERLVVRHGPMVRRVCRDILGDFAAADDAFQATFLVLFRQAGSIRDRDSVGRWLYEVACRVARRARTGDSKRRDQERRALMSKADIAPEDELADREWRPILHEEIRSLPVKLRDAIVLCYLEGLTVEAAAVRLDCPSGTLKSRLSKARDLLRSRLHRRGLAASVIMLLMFSVETPTRAAVPTALVQSTVRVAFGGPGAVAGRVEAMTGEDQPRRGARLARGGAILVLLLATLGVARWSLATGTQEPVVPPAITNFAAATQSVVARWTSLVTGAGETARHCKLTP